MSVCIQIEDVALADPMGLDKSRGASRRGKRKKRGVSGRACRTCGKDPYPNYFYCPVCHHRISSSGGDDLGDFREPD